MPRTMPIEAKKLLKKQNVEEFNNSTDNKITKFNAFVNKISEEKKVTGVVLRPGVFDADGSIMDEKTIVDAAENFLSVYNQTTKLGIQHFDFTKDLELRQSFIAPQDLMINDNKITKGSWVITVKINSDDIWQKVKKGKITGFSIGGKAKIKRVEE